MIRNRFSRNLGSFLRKSFSLQILFVAILFSSLSSCYNEPSIIGDGLIPSDDKIELHLDTTFQVNAYTVGVNNVPTNYYQFAVLGNVNSSIFGSVKSDFVTRYYPNSVFNLKDTAFYKRNPRPLASSFVLNLVKRKVWGKNKTALNIKVYELDESIKDSSGVQTYYNGLTPSIAKHKPVEIGSATYKGEDTLKIDVSSAFTDLIRNAKDSVYFDATKFQKYFKGIYITADSLADAGVLYFFDNYVEFVFKYKDVDISTGNIVDKTFFFYSTNYTARYNRYKHYYSGSSIKPMINDTLSAQPLFFVEGLGGARGMLKFVDVAKWKEKMPIVIHKAELKIKKANFIGFPADSALNPISYYYKRRYNYLFSNTSTDYENIVDYGLTKVEQSGFFKKDETYSIDVTLHLQNILTGRIKNNNMFIDGSSKSSYDFKYNYGQGIFDGNDIKLIITYSKL